MPLSVSFSVQVGSIVSEGLVGGVFSLEADSCRPSFYWIARLWALGRVGCRAGWVSPCRLFWLSFLGGCAVQGHYPHSDFPVAGTRWRESRRPRVPKAPCAGRVGCGDCACVVIPGCSSRWYGSGGEKLDDCVFGPIFVPIDCGGEIVFFGVETGGQAWGCWQVEDCGRHHRWRQAKIDSN